MCQLLKCYSQPFFYVQTSFTRIVIPNKRTEMQGLPWIRICCSQMKLILAKVLAKK